MLWHTSFLPSRILLGTVRNERLICAASIAGIERRSWAYADDHLVIRWFDAPALRRSFVHLGMSPHMFAVYTKFKKKMMKRPENFIFIN
jgi:hypothetical protein